MRNETPKHVRSGKYNLNYNKFQTLLSYNKNNEYNNFLKNKRIIIVGPSSHLFEIEQKDFIESFDIIVRVNKSYPVKEEQMKYIGERTDILYHCLEQSEINCGKLNYDQIEKDNVIISTPYPKNMTPFHIDYIKFENETFNKSIKTNYINIDFYDIFMKSLGTRPNTGISAIADLMCYDIKSLYICGFTFFETGFYKGYRNIDNMMKTNNDGSTVWSKFDKNFNNNHNQELQKEFIKMLFENDKRIDGEEKLKEIINDRYKL